MGVRFFMLFVLINIKINDDKIVNMFYLFVLFYLSFIIFIKQVLLKLLVYRKEWQRIFMVEMVSGEKEEKKRIVF